ncbi:MAG TPA: hypothetical protein VMD91_15930 [Candidatus Sulfotelmatobacter sp.]|nr:hypothetical protein [Candidatus Sulfotelmatobacter sp.]
MDEDARDEATSTLPKYRQPGFMEKELSLYQAARAATISVRRYGDNTIPITAVTPVDAPNAIAPVEDFNDPNDR